MNTACVTDASHGASFTFTGSWTIASPTGAGPRCSAAQPPFKLPSHTHTHPLDARSLLRPVFYQRVHHGAGHGDHAGHPRAVCGAKQRSNASARARHSPHPSACAAGRHLHAHLGDADLRLPHRVRASIYPLAAPTHTHTRARTRTRMLPFHAGTSVRQKPTPTNRTTSTPWARTSSRSLRRARPTTA